MKKDHTKRRAFKTDIQQKQYSLMLFVVGEGSELLTGSYFPLQSHIVNVYIDLHMFVWVQDGRLKLAWWQTEATGN